MKTRADIYGIEAAELLRLISMYPGITDGQMLRFFPGKTEKIKNLLSHLTKQGRIFSTDTGNCFPAGHESPTPAPGLLQAVWVLLDFLDRAEYHSCGEFPSAILFFAAGELYEVIPVPLGQEALIAIILQHTRTEDSRRIVVVDEPAQIAELDFPNISGYCTAGEDGQVHYYQKSNGGL